MRHRDQPGAVLLENLAEGILGRVSENLSGDFLGNHVTYLRGVGSYP
jgi:hypothetical protein